MMTVHRTIKLVGTTLMGLALGLITGCGVTTIDISGSYPSPLVEELPLRVGVYYQDSFRNHSFTETNNATGEDQYIINSGQSQIDLFNTVLPSMFRQVVEIESMETAAEQHPELAAVFVPQVQEFQVGLPSKTKLNVYEIWIRYNMRLANTNGDNIADWAMTAYGKSPTESFQSTSEGVNNAAVVALRDLAANFALGFTEVPEVNEWLREQSLLNE